MPTWPPDVVENVIFDVGFALTFKVGRRMYPVDELQRRVIARAIVEHLQRSNWEIKRGPPIEMIQARPSPGPLD